MNRIQTHYMSLSVTTLFKHHPSLETYLRENYDEKLIIEVCHFITQVHSPTTSVLMHMPDVGERNKQASGGHPQGCEAA